MDLKRRVSILLIPDGEGRTREWRIPRLAFLGAGVALTALLLVAGLYAVDWVLGAAWRPGGSPLQRDNVALQQEVARFETRVAALQDDLDEVFAYQQALAAAVEITPLDAQTRAAGVGGRGPLLTGGELASLHEGPDLDQLLRQARIQRAGMAAMLDTLAAREMVRERLPSIRPCDIGWLSSRYGKRRDPFTGKQAFHRGLDFSVPVGTPVRVTAAGVVRDVERQRGLGRLVKVDHGGGVVTVYGHLHETLVTEGQEVARGEVIARSGNSGRSTAPHLHYEVRVAKRSVNPLAYILDTYAELP